MRKNEGLLLLFKTQPLTDPRRQMNIQQLSHNIDQKVAQIDKQLASLQHKLSTESTADKSLTDQLHKDMAALEQIKTKLQKSRSIMWQAHELQLGTDQKRLRQKHWLGVGLLVLSGVGLIALLIMVLAGN